MKHNKLNFLLVFLAFSFLAKAQTNSSRVSQNQAIVNHWFEAPESSKGDTVVFKTTKHVLGPNDDPAYAWSEFVVKSNNTFSVEYWNFCRVGNLSNDGAWSMQSSGVILFDFGANKCKCEMQIISVLANELKAIVKEKTN